LIGAKARKIQARLNGQPWKAGIMFYPANAFFGDGEEQFPIADNACGRIMHFCVVDAERDHSEVRFLLKPVLRASVFASRPV
jgi:hypothetical protein